MERQMKARSIFSAAVLAAAMVGSVFAQEKKNEYVSVDEVKAVADDYRDFQIQGEYVWYAGGKVFACQCIANGDGKFTVVGFPGGFPGMGWHAKEARIYYEGGIEGNEVILRPTKMDLEGQNNLPMMESHKDDITKIDLAGTTMTFCVPGKPDRIAKKFVRPNDRVGVVEDGAVILYDGTAKDKTNTDNIASYRKINEETGAMFAEFVTKELEKGKECLVHVEFMLSFMPRAKGQARSNSGVYLYEAYECQVLDSFGLRGENNECGGFYQQKRPLANAVQSPLTWQAYDFHIIPAKYENGKKVANAKVDVALNGILIHDGLEISGHTPGRKAEADEARGIYFQGHGNNVQYRNIWVKYVD